MNRLDFYNENIKFFSDGDIDIELQFIYNNGEATLDKYTISVVFWNKLDESEYEGLLITTDERGSIWNASDSFMTLDMLEEDLQVHKENEDHEILNTWGKEIAWNELPKETRKLVVGYINELTIY